MSAAHRRRVLFVEDEPGISGRSPRRSRARDSSRWSPRPRRARPVATGGRTEGAIRITQSIDAVGRATRRAIVGLAAVGGLVLVLGLAAGTIIAGQVAGPLGRLDAAARRVAGGDLSARAEVEGSAEQRRLARTFNEMTARLERLLSAQRDFVADASHQLRTPLSGPRLRLEEARAAAREPEAHEEIDAGLRELDRLSAIVTELLVLSEAGEIDAPGEPVDLTDALRRAAARWDGRVEVAAAVEGPPARCAPADLDRILDALIENALHYGGSTALLAARPGAVEVSDDGPGLAADELDGRDTGPDSRPGSGDREAGGLRRVGRLVGQGSRSQRR